MLVRLCKTALVATVALFFLLVAFGNLTDYGSNWAFVRHVLAMDTIFPDSTLTWRAITAEWAQELAYWLIIAWEIAAGLVLAWASLRLFAARGSARRFNAARPLALAGLTLGLLLYGLGFIVIGGEWFAMWQSPTWNGQDSAARFLILIGLVFLALLHAESEN
jgi:predicted small integral membrane protein